MSETRYQRIKEEGGMVINLALSKAEADIVRAIVSQHGEYIGTSDAIRIALRAYEKSTDAINEQVIEQVEKASKAALVSDIAGRIISEVMARREWSVIDHEASRAVEAAFKVAYKIEYQLARLYKKGG